MFLYATDLSLLVEAEELVSFTQQLKIVTEQPFAAHIYLRLDSNGLAVISHDFNPIYVKEIYAKLVSRTKNLHKELLIQAIKINPLKQVTKSTGLQNEDCTKQFANNDIIVWDLTAGLGKDALLISSFGYKVMMVEQNPVLATILHYALRHNILSQQNLHLVYADSLDFLTHMTTRPHIIYLDPMFKDKKSAKAKKDMQIIQSFSHSATTQQEQNLFAACYIKALTKIVVKRENKQANLIMLPKPSYIKLGNTVRYDIYTI